jgi:hypothetical protein
MLRGVGGLVKLFRLVPIPKVVKPVEYIREKSRRVNERRRGAFRDRQSGHDEGAACFLAALAALYE